MVERLSGEARSAALAGLDGWSEVTGRDAIQKRFTFAGFPEAFAFMTRVALIAERMDHHPEWTNVWNRVDVVLTTHSAKGLSRLDVELAAAIDGGAG